MYSIFRSKDGMMYENTMIEKNVWINLIAPSEDELRLIAKETEVFYDFLRYPLDDEERPRVEIEDGQILTIIDIPHYDYTNATYDTMPMGIIITPDHVITVGLKDTGLLDDFSHNRFKGLSTAKRTRFLFLILYKNAMVYLRHLREIDRKTTEIESELHKSLRNKELIRLMNLSKSLVYFSTSLRSNQAVLERLLRTRTLKKYEEDEDLLEDVIIENRQAMEMSDIYTNILTGTMDASASLISNNLNNVMKFLAAITIIMALPTMVFSFFGMNVDLPLVGMIYPQGFLAILALSIILSSIAVWFLYRKDMF
jgi:magnesium transporter